DFAKIGLETLDNKGDKGENTSCAGTEKMYCRSGLLSLVGAELPDFQRPSLCTRAMLFLARL
ncbi:hypothetical protein Dimus_021591, partial [Dionaea muscipula]